MPSTPATDNIAEQNGLSYGRLEQLSDGELLASTRGLVGKSNQLLAALLLTWQRSKPEACIAAEPARACTPTASTSFVSPKMPLFGASLRRGS